MAATVRLVCLTAILTTASSWAQQVGTEASLLPVVLSPGPQWTGASDRVWGELAFTDFLTARLDLSLSKLAGPPPPTGSRLRSTDEWIGLGILGLDGELGDHWAFHFDGQLSPPSTQEVAISAAGRDARLRATSDSYGTTASVGYASFGESPLEWSVDLVGGWTHYDSLQRIDAIELGSTQTAAQIRAECKGVNTSRCKTLLSSLKSEAQALDQGRLGLLPTLTLFGDTDVTLGFTYDFFAQDPTALGDFRLATLGRTATVGTAQTAPLVWSVRPELTRRLGRLSLTASWLHGVYVGDNGFTDTLSLKAQVKLGDWRVWAGAMGNRDVDGGGAVTPSVSFSLGVRLRW